MRIEKEYGKRTSHFKKEMDERVKFIIAFEGEKTEIQYFEGINNNKLELNISSLIEIIPLRRGIVSESESHPIKTLKYLIEHLEQYNTPAMVIDKIVDFCCKSKSFNMLDSKELKNHFLETFKQLFPDSSLEENVEDKDEFIKELIKSSWTNSLLIKQIERISTYISQQELPYIEDYDQICLVIDRDNQNLSLEQLESVINICREKNINLFVSNPTFEFWLLLHTEDVLKYPKEKLLENRRENKKKYIEKLLDTHFDGYDKANINFEDQFMDKIETAINLQRYYAHEINLLKEQLGTNVGSLVEKLLFT
ncbi:MAG: RloB family protein [Sphaerochaetaceae bacterium]